MEPFRVLVSAHQFRIGLGVGCVAAAMVVAVRVAARRPLPLAGVAFATAACVALQRSGDVAGRYAVPAALPAGVLLAGALAHIAGRLRMGTAFVALAAVPGAVVTAGSVVSAPTWVRVAVAGFGAIGGALFADYEASDRFATAPILWLIAVAGVYWTVPDTEAARAVLGAALPIALLGWPRRSAWFGPGGAVASACLLGWVIGQGGTPRPGAVVGGVATLGVLATAPLVRRLVFRPRADLAARSALTVAWIVTAQLGVVAAASRWAGLAHDASTAGLRLLAFAPIAVLLTLAIDVVPRVSAPRE